MKGLVVFGALLTLLSGCSGSKAHSSFLKPGFDDYKVGEKWVWQYKGVTTDGIVRANGTDVKEVVMLDGSLFLSDGTNHTQIRELVKKDENPTPRFKWPLEAGKKWKYEESWTSQDGTTGKTSYDAEVLRFAEEEVGAGKFMAYTIQYKGKLTNSRGYNAAIEETLIYAPKVKNFIKLTQTQGDYVYVEELIEYSN